MLRSTRRYLRAAGSIMDIMPSTNYEKYVKSASDSEQIHGDLIAISNDMAKVIESYGKKIKSGSGKSKERAGLPTKHG